MKFFLRNTLKKKTPATGGSKDANDSLPDMVFALDANTGRITQCNKTLCDVTGFSKDEIIGRQFFDLYYPDCREQVKSAFIEFTEKGNARNEELQILLKSGGKLDVSLNATAHQNPGGNTLYSQAHGSDIEELKDTKEFLYGQNQILEKIARGAELKESLTALIMLIERQDERMICAIVLLDDDGVHVRYGAAPQLPAEYIAALEGQPIGASAGSCGTAMYRREPVYVEDIALDPLWDDYRSVALAANLRACWATPIFDKDGGVLGTFAVYYTQPKLPKLPDPSDLRLVNTAASIAAIAIDRYRSEYLLERNRIRITNMFEQANDGIFIVSADGKQYLDVNPHGAEMFGYSRDEFLIIPVNSVLSPSDMERLSISSEGMMEGEGHIGEWECIRKDGSIFTGEVSARRLDDCSFLAIVRDLSERKRIEGELKGNEQRFRLALEAAHLGTFDWNTTSNKIIWSRYHEEAWGFLDGEFDGTYEGFAKRIHPDDLPELNAMAQHCVASYTPFDHEFRIVWPDGSIHWILAKGEMLNPKESDTPRMLGAVVDITSRKVAELELKESNHQLEKLSRKILSAQEAERRNVARELHDEIGQLLTVVKLDLQTVLRKTGSEALAPALKEGMESIDRVVARVRDLSLDLRPSMLDDLGLISALRWYVMRQADRLGEDVEVGLHLVPVLPSLAEEIGTACFRIAQESFTNILRHAHAKRIQVELSMGEGYFELSVHDDGVGFDSTQYSQGFGLLSMKERAELAGGHLEIDSAPGQGTKVLAQFPIAISIEE